ncbi:hypothetical protein T02_13925 [Trichinella nativa]|uniref:Uncharacterized protein n=1 Tax=Trichinella nativa TaxID=6335 RepID=A0A0V1KZN3_9BILA|nr:hypothetical protein T02_13925 [Trichinella nativa]
MGVYRQSKVRLFPPYLVDRLSNRNLHDVQKIQSVFEIRELKTRGFDYWRIFDGHFDDTLHMVSFSKTVNINAKDELNCLPSNIRLRSYK